LQVPGNFLASWRRSGCSRIPPDHHRKILPDADISKSYLHGMHVSLALAVVLLSAGNILSYLGLKKHTRADMVAPHG
jgi:hypothetical protein